MSQKPSFFQKKYSPTATRRYYGKIATDFVQPNLADIQIRSYQTFLDHDLENLIAAYFPIKSPNDRYTINFKGLRRTAPERNEAQSRSESKTYEIGIYADLELIDSATGTIKKPRKSKKNSATSSVDGVFLTNLPLITRDGVFIVNGIEKFVIAQITRSPGIYMLTKSQLKLSSSRKRVQEGYVCEVLPANGSVMLIYISNKKKIEDAFVQILLRDAVREGAKIFPITTLLKAFGMSGKEILKVFKNNEFITRSLEAEVYNAKDFLNNVDPEIKNLLREFRDGKTDLRRKGIASDQKIRSLVSDYVLLEKEHKALSEAKPNDPKVGQLEADMDELMDKIITERAAKHIVHELSISLRGLENTDECPENSYHALLCSRFFRQRRYNLSAAGRYKVSRKLRITERIYQKTLACDLHLKNGELLLKKGTLLVKEEIDKIKQAAQNNQIDFVQKIKLTTDGSAVNLSPESLLYESLDVYVNNDNFDVSVPVVGIHNDNDLNKAITLSDFIASISYVINIPSAIGKYDDIDHLGNKRVKLINELISSRLESGITRMERFLKEKLTIADGVNRGQQINEEGQVIEQAEKKELTIKSLINSKPIQIVIRDFFNTHQLTQFLDHQNPLSELSNKRRISAMGPGGISREDPNLDIRDVHYSQYGRICPIETPEGMNIGLIMSLASFAKIDENGFLMAPYRKIKNGVITDEVEYLTALREDEHIIAEISSLINIDENNKILDKEIIGRYRSMQGLYDPSKIDYIDVAPHQVVSIGSSLIPFLENDDSARALMGTNMQRQAYPLIKPYAPVVGTGQEYKIARDSGLTMLAPCSGTVKYVDNSKITIESDSGEQHTLDLIKFERSNQNTCYNHVPLVEKGQRVTKDEVIADGPAVNKSELSLGQNVLVAFTTWNGYNYEDAIVISERLVKDDVLTSLTINEYVAQCLSTKNGDEQITRDIPNVSDANKRYLDENGIIMVGAEVKEGDVLVGKVSPKGQVEVSPEEKLFKAIFPESVQNVRDSSLKLPHGGDGIVSCVKRFSIANGNELNDGVIEMIKVYVVQKRKIQIGDKLAGRHGNKGVISKVVPVADMPHLEDGTPVDILLNPLGVPSRMNIGQIFEMHLGYAAHNLAKRMLISACFDDKKAQALSTEINQPQYKLDRLITGLKAQITNRGLKDEQAALAQLNNGDIALVLKEIGMSFDDLHFKVATPIFQGVNFQDLQDIMDEAGLKPAETHGKFKLIDGRTGLPFEKPISLGIMYMMKLNHMVDDKIHARAVGPYSKITQQPLGGKSQNGGQRFGEMEVWALEAYGAAYNLQELLTIKSDDVQGRNKAYAAIVKGAAFPEPGIPESFKLLTKELQGLALSVSFIYDDNTQQDSNNVSILQADGEQDDLFNDFEFDTEGY
ncbi:DNA-directed RNA polymerase subunit beta [Mycoplasmoides pneumoniae]|uniref:DNA-directed RNA polymerase subunit beta n=1 Tax=Mycoplasmoides pneumoniae TaxID=2104 RepID=UPI0006A747E9|nr:DNA-directed RNA polymerase subunit beta [Mycoplasmoides pneumoniae]ALA36718.1 DNA-directed RNA polymerase subunit beta [Mycoplasmoides pneumoniae M1139]